MKMILLLNVTTTDVTAIVGALTGTAALIWQLVNGYLDRRTRLAVTVTDGFGASPEDGSYVKIRATVFNLSKVPIPITGVYLWSAKLVRYEPSVEGPVLVDMLSNTERPFPQTIEPGAPRPLR